MEYGPPLFFALMDVLEDAIHCNGSGASLSEFDQARIEQEARELSHPGKSLSDDVARLLSCRQNSHPPAWLRGRRPCQTAGAPSPRIS